MKNVVLGTVSFIIVSFILQALSHFVINTEHYASVDFVRNEPILWMGVLTMVIQGSILSYLFPKVSLHKNVIKNGLFFGISIGIFFVSYIAMVEPSKYAVENVTNWFLVESMVGLTQFALFGICLGVIHSKK
jgi:hypothetical protein